MSKEKQKPGCGAFILFILFSIASIPVALMSYAYVTKCAYFWYMPYIMASFPKLEFSSFIALNVLIAIVMMWNTSKLTFDVTNINSKLKKITDSNGLWDLYSSVIGVVYLVPWLGLLFNYIMFKIITCFISPVVA
jgi:hypothetical protein